MSGKSIFRRFLKVSMLASVVFLLYGHGDIKAEAAQRVNVDFGTGSWNVGDITVTAEERSGKTEISTDDTIKLTNFDDAKMTAQVTGAENFKVELKVENGETSLAARTTEGGYPDGTLLFQVVEKTGEPSQPSQPSQIENPIEIAVTIQQGQEYLDSQGDYLKVDNISVSAGGKVTVEKAQQHTISILPQFGISVSMEINGKAVQGSTENGWTNYIVAEENSYSLSISKSGNSAVTVIWNYQGDQGSDAVVSNGTVKILSAVLPDGQNGIGSINTQDQNGGHVEIKPGSTVTVELKPNYGYQFVSGSLNGQTITAGAEVSRFTFTMPDTNLHLSALFTQTPDQIDTNHSKIASAGLTNGANAVDSGNLKLTVRDLEGEEITSVENGINRLVGSADKVQMYLNMDLCNVVNKGTTAEFWENQLSELRGKVTVSLELPEELKRTESKFYAVREHMETNGTKSYEKIPVVYDSNTGKISFETDKFSTYAIVKENAIAYTVDNDPTNACNGKLSDNGNLAEQILTAEEIQNIRTSGESVAFSLTVKDVTADAGYLEEKKQIDLYKGNKSIALYFDIGLTKTIGSTPVQSVTETNGEITITLKLPIELINTDSQVARSYYIARYHNGEVKWIPCEYNATAGTISFKTDKFSVYALGYHDQAATSGNTGSNHESSSGGNFPGNNTAQVMTVDSAIGQTLDAVPKSGEGIGTYIAETVLLFGGIVLIYTGILLRKTEDDFK